MPDTLTYIVNVVEEDNRGYSRHVIACYVPKFNSKFYVHIPDVTYNEHFDINEPSIHCKITEGVNNIVNDYLSRRQELPPQDNISFDKYNDGKGRKAIVTINHVTLKDGFLIHKIPNTNSENKLMELLVSKIRNLMKFNHSIDMQLKAFECTANSKLWPHSLSKILFYDIEEDIKGESKCRKLCNITNFIPTVTLYDDPYTNNIDLPTNGLFYYPEVKAVVAIGPFFISDGIPPCLIFGTEEMDVNSFVVYLKQG